MTIIIFTYSHLLATSPGQCDDEQKLVRGTVWFKEKSTRLGALRSGF